MRDDERIEKLGTYFVHFRIHTRFGISFQTFCAMVDGGAWKGFIENVRDN